MEDTIKVCIYARVSTQVQDYQRQIEEINKYCRGYGYKIAKRFTEKESGKKRKRSALKDLLDYCETNQDNISYVIISELSRIGRSGEVINTIERLNDLQICLISIKESLKTLNDDKSVNYTSGLILSILSSINYYELETIKYWSKSGLLSSARKGNWGGGKMLPYGYMREKNGKKLVINRDEAPIIKEIFKMYVSGSGTLKIATYLNGKGFPTRTGVKWRDKVVYDIIRNPIYFGNRRYKGEILEAPIIIDETLYIKANEIRVNNYNKSNSNRKYKYLLNQQIIECGICGKSYYPHKRASLRDNTYKCISIRYGDNCGNAGINIDKLEFAIKYVFINDFTSLIQINTNELDNIENELKSYETEYKKTKKGQSRILNVFASGIINEKELENTLKDLKSEEVRVKKLIDETKLKLGEIKQEILFSANFTLTNENKYELESYNIPKVQIRQVIKKIRITPDKKKLTKINNDRTLKIEIKTYQGNTVNIYLSQRADYFLYKNSKIDIIRPEKK